jgi:hypothetical protein
MSIMPMRQYTNIERRLADLKVKQRRLETMTLGWRSVDDYIAALKYFDEEVQVAFDAVRNAIVEAHTPDA